ncbi:MAG TPA: hypothetical protein VJ276_20055 [Thermoanaerobaculia bacterium]|nr:hypothetical protein [Thermoanaerobaculia bacterium]
MLVVCADCGRRREVSGEMPEDYLACFLQVVQEEGFVPRPGVQLAMICGPCAATYKGHETVDDDEKINA